MNKDSCRNPMRIRLSAERRMRTDLEAEFYEPEEPYAR